MCDVMENKIYRINYVVSTELATCTVYSYPIIDEKKTYFLIRSGKNNRQIKKVSIGVIQKHHIDFDEMSYYVFVTDLSNKNKYINQMIRNSRIDAENKIAVFNMIYNNAVECDINFVEVEQE